MSADLWFLGVCIYCVYLTTCKYRLARLICPIFGSRVSILAQQNLTAQLRKLCRHQKKVFLDEHMTEA